MIGQLRFRAEILENTESTSKNGFATKEWNVLREVWCGVSEQKQTITEENEKRKKQVTQTFVLRWQPDLSMDHRIGFRGKVFAILSIEDKDFARKYLEIETEEVGT